MSPSGHNRRLVLVTIALVAALSGLVTAVSHEESEAASRWRPGHSSDRVEGDAGAGSGSSPPASAPRRKTRRCASRACSSRRSNPSGHSSRAEKEMVLPKPEIAIHPERSGLVGTTSWLRVVSVESFGDYVGVDGTGARVDARPVRAECTADGVTIGASMTANSASGRAFTPWLALPLERAGVVSIACRLFWDVRWRADDGTSGEIPHRWSWNERSYPVGGIVSVLVR